MNPLAAPLVLTVLLASACATTMPRTSSQGAAPRHRPVLLVHGIDDDARKLRPLEARLRANGWTELELLEFSPNDASSGLVDLAQQLDRAARALLERTGAKELDVVGFSMGALVARYWLRRVDGHVPVRRYVSISGPHHGTWIGYFRWNDGAKQMRPSSPFIQDLARDEGEWGGVEAFTFWTPFDLMIAPATSSRLKGAVEQTFPVIAHPLMMYDARVLDAVVEALGGPEAPGRTLADAPPWP